MANSYPIWHAVQACHYKSDKSWGEKDTSQDNILVGSSKNNSHTLANTITTRKFYTHDKYGDVCVFKYSVDGIVVKELIFKDKNGRAGELLKKRSALTRMKGL